MASAVGVLNKAFDKAGSAAVLGADGGGVCAVGDERKLTSESVLTLREAGFSDKAIGDLFGLKIEDVNAVMQTSSGAARAQVIKTDKLKKILKTPATPATPWPIGPDVVRDIGDQYPDKVEDAYRAWRRSLPLNERLSIKSYTGDAYSDINSGLRATKSGTIEGSAKNIQNALSSAPKPPPPELVWRGVDSDFAKTLKLGQGDVIQLNGFQSTSISPQFADSWGSVVFEIKPASGAYIRSISNAKKEFEFLLPSGVKYRVRGVVETFLKDRMGIRKKKFTVVQLEMIG